MSEHPPLTDFERFVSGGAPLAGQFEQHVSECDACAHLLASEARVELVARACARELAFRRAWISRLKGPGYVMGAVFAAAASLLILSRAMSAAQASSALIRDDASGQPTSFLAPDAGFDGHILALSDGGRRRY